MTIPLSSMTMVQMAATGRYLQRPILLMAMPMEMSSLGPMVGKLVGFLGPMKIEKSPKKGGFCWENAWNMFFNGKIHTSAVVQDFCINTNMLQNDTTFSFWSL